MRLTLRTLLAYMDDILDPADHEDLGNKIEASDFASELIHRSRDTVRRLRLGAPAVLSDGSDDVLDSLDLSDANSVAEYLDNTLPPEQVADFERMCLEPGTAPDMHLAEVASCHHVLTMVLGEPAEVDADLKARMYQLPEKLANGQKLRIEPAHVAAPPIQPAEPTAHSAASSAAPPLAQPASLVVEQHHELPDYLREAAASKRRSRRWAILTSLLAIGGVVLWFANPPEADPPADVAKLDTQSFDDIEIDMQGPSSEIPSNVTAPATTVPATPGGEDTTSEAPAFSAAPSTPTTEAPEVLTETAPAETAAPADSVTPAIEPETGMIEADSATDATASAEASVPLIPLFSGAKQPSTSDAAAALEAEAGTETDTAADAPMVEEEATTPEVIPEAIEEPAVVEPAGPQRLGNYLGNNDVLLIHNTRRDKWIRIPPRSPISTGDELLTLPKYRTHVVLADINTYLWGGTRVHLPVEKFDTLAADTELNLEMIYGRLMLNAGLKGSQVAMQVGDQLREFHMAGSASLAVEVQRVFVPGTDYEKETAPIIATWYLTSGSVEWPTASGGTQTIKTPAIWKTIDGIDEIPELLQELPAWIDREQLTGTERSASEDIAKELDVDRPVGIRLLELTEGKGLGRRKEVRVLAAASSVFVGEFEPLVKTLNDGDQNRVWETHIQALRQAMAQSPEDAVHVRQAFVNLRGEEAAQDLLEMVVGYNAEHIGTTRDAIQTGALSRLIQWLDHDSLDYRVLASHNIRQIVGKVKGYRPDDTSKRRKIRLRKLWEEFEDNELLPQ